MASTAWRFLETLPLFVASLGFVVAAWIASAHHLRIFSSQYPVWMVLALDAAVAAFAGTAGVFVTEPEVSVVEDPEVVRMPRSQWESQMRRLEAAEEWGRTHLSAAVVSLTEGPLDVGRLPTQAPEAGPHVLPLRLPKVAVAPPNPDAEPSELSGEVALLELQGMAEGIFSTGEYLGVEELQTLLDESGEDLTRISKILGSPRRPRESSSALLIRLLRLHPAMSGAPTGRFSAGATDRLAANLSSLIPATPNPRQTSRRPPANLGAAADEFDELLRELQKDVHPPE